MNDQEIMVNIEQLVNEEHSLRRLEAQGTLSDPQHRRMRELEVKLDQCWDLLRQRRARRDAGLNPDEAQARNAAVVEHFEQ